MDKKITFKSFGKKAILIEWDAIIDEEILNDILNFKQKIEDNLDVLFTDLIVGYNSLTIRLIDEWSNFLILESKLKNIYKTKLQVKKELNYLWKIPVCYDSAFGIDLEEISLKTNFTKQEIVKLHSEKIYTVFFIGFLPGFLYLGGLNPQIFVDRKSNPRLKVEKGAVAIGGQQTGVYPTESSGGWNIIGKTPIDFFNIENQNPCFAKAGDKIKFLSISKNEFYLIEKEIAKGDYQLSKSILDD